MNLAHRASVLLLLVCASCQAGPEASVGLCERHPVGTKVSWQGAVVGTHHHGYGLTAEDCRGFIRLTGVRIAPGGRDLESFFEPARLQPGVLRADITGKIIRADDDEPILLVERVHRLAFEKMTDEQERLYWRRRHEP